ncbi:MAG TPA: hypothetical protein VGD56_06030 [Gemmatirosa sp.]
MSSGQLCRPRVVAAVRALGLTAAAAAARPVAAQHSLLTDSAARPVLVADSARAAAPAVRVAPSSFWSRVTVEGEWAHVGAGPVSRPDAPYTAVRSLVGTASVALGPVTAPRARLDLGWVRGVRSPSTSQGVTAGASLPLSVLGGRAHLYPGIAAAAGWSESQAAAWRYDWVGVDGTPSAGQRGVHTAPAIERSGMAGLGVHVAGDVPLAHGVALAASVRQWAFRGRAAADPHMLLAGVGLAFHPAGAR